MVYFYNEGKPYGVWSNVIAKDGTETQERLFNEY